MKNYYDAHESAYREIQSNGYVGWGNVKTLEELGDQTTLDFLSSSVTKWIGPVTGKKALDLGCGTGATAFALSKLGFAVTGIDISETAIEIANSLSKKQNFNIYFKKWDILQLGTLNEKFDLIYDSHCLHCIVFNEDRSKVLEEIKHSLNNSGIFILDTAVITDKSDPTAGMETLRFDENYILWHKTAPSLARGIVKIGDQHWCAQRRFYPSSIIRDEISRLGFKVISEYYEDRDDSVHGMLRLVLTT